MTGFGMSPTFSNIHVFLLAIRSVLLHFPLCFNSYVHVLQLLFRRAVVLQLADKSLGPHSTTGSIADATRLFALSSRTQARMLDDIKEMASLGDRVEQFQKIESYFVALCQADENATTDVEVTDCHEFVRCFVAWGFSRVAITLVKPVVAVDGAHLTPQGTGTVCPFSTFHSFLHFLILHWLYRYC